MAVYALLVASNRGEFWPFSIYPMFSQGGLAWSRAVVREVPEERVQWQAVSLDQLPGEAYALAEHGIDHIGFGSFVAQTRVWDAARVETLRRMLGEAELQRRNLLVLRVSGRITERDSVIVSFRPVALLTKDTSRVNDPLLHSPSP